MAFAILRVTKLKGGSINASDLHTERAQETPNANEEFTEENVYLRGEKGVNVREKIDALFEERSIKPRLNAVECQEYLMTASPDYFRNELGEIDPDKTANFLERADDFMTQLEERGMVFVKSVVHLDELTPHVVAYGVPIDERGRLCAKSYTGGREKMRALQDQYAETMKPLDLERGIKGSRATHARVSQYYGKMDRYDEAIENEREAAELLKQTTEQLRLATVEDVLLIDVATRLFPTAETTQGTAVLGLDDPREIQALITPNNQAFSMSGENLSNGSSIKFLENLTQVEPANILKTIGEEFGEKAATNAAKAYGDEIALDLLDKTNGVEPGKIEFDQEAVEIEVAEAAEAAEVAEAAPIIIL